MTEISIKEIAAKLRDLADQLDPPKPKPEFRLMSDEGAADVLRRHSWIANPAGVVARLKAMNCAIVQMKDVDR